MVQEDIKVSIVIPLYNCSKYLKKCLDSIISQDYPFLEIILIDDESTDDSGDICEQYASKDKRVTVIHQKKAGVATARNKGIELASGKYIVFFDSDDYVDSDFISFAVKKMESENLDLFNAGFYSEVHSDVITKDLITFQEKLYTSLEELKVDLVSLWDAHMLYNVWNKMYSLTLIKKHNLQFPNMNFGEDMKFNISYLKFVNRFYNTDRCFYHYIKERSGSLTSKYKENLFEIRKAEYKEFVEYFNNLGIENYQEFNSRRFIERVLGCVENICSSNLTKKEKKKAISVILKDPVVAETIKIANPKSKKVKIMLIPLKLKSTFLTHFTGNFISNVRKKFPHLFNKLKNKR